MPEKAADGYLPDEKGIKRGSRCRHDIDPLRRDQMDWLHLSAAIRLTVEALLGRRGAETRRVRATTCFPVKGIRCSIHCSDLNEHDNPFPLHLKRMIDIGPLIYATS